MKKRLISLILSAVLLFSAAAPSYATIYDDIFSHWAKDAIRSADSYGWVNGSGSKFNPDANITRADFVTILARIEHADLDNSISKFNDVPAGQYYTGAVSWACSKGIVSGSGNGNFNPMGKITRQEMCKIIKGYLSSLGVIPQGAVGTVFTDESLIASWAKDSVDLCASLSIVQGSNNKFNPQNNATRAEAVAVFLRMSTIAAKILNIDETDYRLYGSNPVVGKESVVVSYLRIITSGYGTALANYEAGYGTPDKVVTDCFNILIPTLEKALKAHDSGTFLSQDYARTTYKSEIEKVKNLYKSMTEDQKTQFQSIVSRICPISYYQTVRSYFEL